MLCCGCFERVRRDQLHRLPDGTVEDVCSSCADREGARTSGELHVPGWRALPDWAVWLALWLLGAVLVVLGGGWQGFLAGVGLLLSGAGMGLLVRRIVEGS